MIRVLDPADKTRSLTVEHLHDHLDQVNAHDADGNTILRTVIEHSPGECAADNGGTKEIVFTRRPEFTLWVRDRNTDA